MDEPGLDAHEWESTWAALDEDAADAPTETLPELVRLIEQMLVERGFDVHEADPAETEEPELVRPFQAARELADRIDVGADVEPEEVADALDDVRAIHDHLQAGRSAP